MGWTEWMGDAWLSGQAAECLTMCAHFDKRMSISRGIVEYKHPGVFRPWFPGSLTKASNIFPHS